MSRQCSQQWLILDSGSKLQGQVWDKNNSNVTFGLTLANGWFIVCRVSDSFSRLKFDKSFRCQGSGVNIWTVEISQPSTNSINFFKMLQFIREFWSIIVRLPS